MTSTPHKSYAAGDSWWRYPRAGDEPAPYGAKCLILTIGGVCTVGQWRDGDCIAWSPMPKRNRDKEQQLKGEA